MVLGFVTSVWFISESHAVSCWNESGSPETGPVVGPYPSLCVAAFLSLHNLLAFYSAIGTYTNRGLSSPSERLSYSHQSARGSFRFSCWMLYDLIEYVAL